MAFPLVDAVLDVLLSLDGGLDSPDLISAAVRLHRVTQEATNFTIAHDVNDFMMQEPDSMPLCLKEYYQDTLLTAFTIVHLLGWSQFQAFFQSSLDMMEQLLLAWSRNGGTELLPKLRSKQLLTCSSLSCPSLLLASVPRAFPISGPSPKDVAMHPAIAWLLEFRLDWRKPKPVQDLPGTTMPGANGGPVSTSTAAHASTDCLECSASSSDVEEAWPEHEGGVGLPAALEPAGSLCHERTSKQLEKRGSGVQPRKGIT